MQTLNALHQSSGGRALADAWNWWTGEMAGMVPERLRPRMNNAPCADIRLGSASVEVDLIDNGVGRRLSDPHRIDDLAEEGWLELASLTANRKLRLILTGSDCFVTTLRLPRQGRARMRAAVAIQMSHISPVDPALIEWAMTTLSAEDNELVVRVAMARSAHIARLQSLFEDNGLDIPAIHAETPEGTLLLALGRGAGSKSKLGASYPRAGLMAAAFLATIPVTTVAAATVLLASAETRIEALQSEIEPKLEARARARKSENVRAALRPLVSRPAVSEIIELLAARLPTTDHIGAIEQSTDRRLIFTVNTASADDVEAALADAPMFRDLRALDVTPTEDGKFMARYQAVPR